MQSNTAPPRQWKPGNILIGLAVGAISYQLFSSLQRSPADDAHLRSPAPHTTSPVVERQQCPACAACRECPACPFCEPAKASVPAAQCPVCPPAAAPCPVCPPAAPKMTLSCPACDCSPGSPPALGWDAQEAGGYHCVRDDWESPVPNFAFLRNAENVGGLDNVFYRNQPMPGIDFRLTEQLRFLETDCARYAAEFNAIPIRTSAPFEYAVNPNGGSYAPVDASVAHCVIRHYKPRRVVEIGSGSSSLVLAAALLKNANEGAPSEFVTVDPHPDSARVAALEALRSANLPITFQWHHSIVQKAPLDLFTSLKPGDVLFIDSSHVARVGHDVNYLFLDVLPQVPAGVLVHVHDIFFPHEYPPFWVLDLKRFLNEQYLLQMLLANSPDWQVEYTGYALQLHFPNRLKAVFAHFGTVPGVTGNPPQVNWQAAAVWIRRRAYSNTQFPALSAQVAALVDTPPPK